jgi:hypothetical protein
MEPVERTLQIPQQSKLKPKNDDASGAAFDMLNFGLARDHTVCH